MKKLLPGPDCGGRRVLVIAMAAFGAGVLASLFLSAKLLVLIESLLILAIAAFCLAAS